MRWPVKFEKINLGYTNHPPALDLVAARGVDIVAPENGVINSRGDDLGYVGGYYLTLKADSGYRYYMGHNSVNLVSRGQRVSEGQHIAEVGATGTDVTGPHVHFQMWNPQNVLVDPRSIIKGEEGEDIVKPSEADVYSAFRQFALKEPDSPDQVQYYMYRDIRDLYHDLMFFEIIPKKAEIRAAFKEFSAVPIDTPPYTDQTKYYGDKPAKVLYRDLALDLQKRLNAATKPPTPVLNKAVVVDYINKNLN